MKQSEVRGGYDYKSPLPTGEDTGWAVDVRGWLGPHGDLQLLVLGRV